jgi:hypothetical protein
MKPYRGALLASAALLAMLQLSGCGDEGDWQKTDGITLKAPSSTNGDSDIIFTVISAPPTIGYACTTLLEYRAEGAGVSIQWRNIPGTETTRVFRVRPKHDGTVVTLARGKCAESKEDWKYSNQVETAVTFEVPALPTVTAIDLIASTPTYTQNTGGVSFTVSGTMTAGCTPDLRYSYTSTGNVITPSTGSGAVPPVGIFTLFPDNAVPLPQSLTVTATGRCTENPTAVVSSAAVVVTVN